MRNIPRTFTYALILIFCSAQLTSCSKDSDLLSDYVLNDELEAISMLVVNDNFSVAQGQSTVLDVLQNDQFADVTNVAIISTTEPQNGIVSINEDNTLTYTPKVESPETPQEVNSEAIADTFTYTAEETTENGETVNEEGVVNINQIETDTDKGYVNFKIFGAVGDGKTDDTAALQLAFDSENSLTADANSVFLISTKLDIDQGFEHSITWKNSVIKSIKPLNPLISINKRGKNGGSTEMKNLLVDGNKLSMRGIQIESKVHFTNVDVTELIQYTEQSPAGLFIKVYDDANSYGDWVFDGCDITNIVAKSNGTIAVDTWGSANGFLFYWTEVPSQTTTITYKNATIENIWGEDAGGFFPNDPTNRISKSDSKIIVENCTFRNAERRQLKGFSSNMFFNRVTFADPEPNNPNIHRATISGMAVFGSGNRENIHFDNCNFIGSGYDGRVIPISVSNFSIKNSEFNGGARLAFTGDIGNGRIENSTFESGSTIFGYSVRFIGNLEIDSKNDGETDYIRLNTKDFTIF